MALSCGQCNISFVFSFDPQKMFLPPLALQQQFAHVVEEVEWIRERQVASGKVIEGLCEGLIATAFAGELVA